MVFSIIKICTINMLNIWLFVTLIYALVCAKINSTVEVDLFRSVFIGGIYYDVHGNT